MSTPTYAELVAELFPRLGGGIRWGLERTQRLLGSVGDPHLRYPTIHIGGTNGKGSVSATLASILRAHGLRTGLYTSPHLCSFRERIQIDGAPIGEDALLAAAARLWPMIQSQGVSFFEATTAIGFLALADAQVDVAVIEVGLGGRLDSTNVAEPVATVLTNVSLDHVQLLGNTVQAVASEKAGIIKRGVPVITTEAEGTAARIIADRVSLVDARLRLVRDTDVAVESIGLNGTTFTYATADARTRTFHTPLIGAHQAVNTALAIAAAESIPNVLRPSVDAINSGIAEVRWPGRLQVERIGGVRWVLDVAHNVAGVQALLRALELLAPQRPVTVLVGVLGDKDWPAMLAPLHAWADRVILTTPPTSPAERTWDPGRAAAGLREAEGAELVVEPDFARALRLAQGGAAAPVQRLQDHDGNAVSTGTVIVTGSFHTVGDALTMLGLCPCEPDVALPRVDFRS